MFIKFLSKPIVIILIMLIIFAALIQMTLAQLSHSPRPKPPPTTAQIKNTTDSTLTNFYGASINVIIVEGHKYIIATNSDNSIAICPAKE